MCVWDVGSQNLTVKIELPEDGANERWNASEC